MKKMMQWVLPLLLVIFGSGACLAQSINAGDIRGSVTDTSGALIPDVAVTVLNVDTGVAKEYTTNNSGLYDTNSIVPGHYTITFTRDGFDQLVRGPITLEVGYTTVNGQLKIGSTKEQVTVSADVSLLSTENGEQSTTMDAKSMDELPQFGQDWQNFVILLPGVSGAGGATSSTSNPGQAAAINGNLPYSNVLSDGASTTLGQSQNANATTFEDVAELQINTSAFSAQYGVGGAIFNQITKSGTSTYHGTAYDFIENQFGSAVAYNFGVKGTAGVLHYNNFGGALGGPLPKIKKAFFYFNYDHIINNGQNSSGGKYTVPTEKMMTGDFSELSAQLYDPTTQTMATDSNGHSYPVRAAFANNKIPSGELSSVGSKFIQWYPTPTSHIAGGQFICGTSTTAACPTGSHGEPINNFASALNFPNPTVRYFGRLDYDVTHNNRLTMTEVETNTTEVSNPSGVEDCPVGCQSSDIENNNSQVTDVWVISPRIVNEARLGYTYQFNKFADQSYGSGLNAKLGWKFAKFDDFPNIDFTDGDWTPAWINKQGNNLYKEHVFDPSDVVTLVAGKHILHFGGEVLAYLNNSKAWNGDESGAFMFGSTNYCGCDNDYTAHWTKNASGAASIDSTSGWAIADFMLGYAAQWSAAQSAEFGARLKSPQLFVQDDWKISPTLTLNLGIRYQINHGWNEVHGNIDSFDPKVINPADKTMGAMWYASTHANGRKSLEADVYDTILPRVGLSWLMNTKTTIRGGFGVYAYNWSADNYGSGIGAPFSSSGSAADATGGKSPITLLDGAGTNYQTGATLPYITAATTADAYNGQSVSFTDYHTPVPRIYQWNLAAQRELSANTVVEINYVASHAFDLIFGGSGGAAMNQIPQSKIQSAGVNNAGIPYPNFNTITGYTNNAVSNYNSLQAQITHRYSSGLTFNFNYVWSHMLDNADSSGWGSHAGPIQYQSSYDPKANYGASNFDQRNAFKGSVVYQLPFGNGKQFLNHSKLLDEAVGGWQVSSTIVLSTGHPFTVTDANEHLTYANGGGAYPNWNPNVSVKPAHRTIQNWFNPGAFTRPADGTFGNVKRNSLYGPGLSLVNISAHKEFTLVEAWKHDVKLQFRADAFNAFNHAGFDVPSNGAQVVGASGPGGAYTSTNAGTPGASGVYQISSLTVGGRKIQYALRLTF